MVSPALNANKPLSETRPEHRCVTFWFGLSSLPAQVARRQTLLLIERLAPNPSSVPHGARFCW